MPATWWSHGRGDGRGQQARLWFTIVIATMHDEASAQRCIRRYCKQVKYPGLMCPLCSLCSPISINSIWAAMDGIAQFKLRRSCLASVAIPSHVTWLLATKIDMGMRGWRRRGRSELCFLPHNVSRLDCVYFISILYNVCVLCPHSVQFNCNRQIT